MNPRMQCWSMLVAAAALGCGASASPEPNRAAAPPGPTVAVESVTVATPVELPAQVYVERDAVVHARTRGTVNWIGVDIGQAVRAGQTLARLESVDEEITLDRTVNARDLAAAAAARQRDLAGRGMVTRADSEQVESQFRQSELAVRQARRDLELTRVTAPFAGVVSARYARTGRLAAPGDSLFRITALSPLLAAVQVPETEARSLRVGGSAEVVASPVSAPARVLRIAPVVDAASGTRHVVVEVRPVRGIVPGTTVAVRLGGANRRALAVPKDAVGNDGLAIVWSGGRATARPVTVGGDLGDGKLEVLAGLAAGEQVIRTRP